MKRTDEFSKNLTEEQLIRRALLSATEEEYQEALRAVPEAPVHTRAYRRWAKRLLRDPFGSAQKTVPDRHKILRAASCIVLVFACSFVLSFFMSPNARAALASQIGFSAQADFPAVDVTVQLAGKGSSHFASTNFYCTKGNGNAIYYQYTNLGEEACAVRLFEKGLFQTKAVGETIIVEPGETASGTYTDLRWYGYYIDLSSVLGGSIHGRLNAHQGQIGRT